MCCAERAAIFVGSDHGAAVFWDRYIAYETSQAALATGGDHSRVAALYRRVLKASARWDPNPPGGIC